MENALVKYFSLRNAFVLILSLVPFLTGCSSRPGEHAARDAVIPLTENAGESLTVLSFEQTDGMEKTVDGVKTYIADWNLKVFVNGKNLCLTKSGKVFTDAWNYGFCVSDMLLKTMHKHTISGKSSFELAESGWRHTYTVATEANDEGTTEMTGGKEVKDKGEIEVLRKQIGADLQGTYVLDTEKNDPSKMNMDHLKDALVQYKDGTVTALFPDVAVIFEVKTLDKDANRAIVHATLSEKHAIVFTITEGQLIYNEGGSRTFYKRAN